MDRVPRFRFSAGVSNREPCKGGQARRLGRGKNSSYRNITRLDNPRNDASLMAETLRSIGFELVGGRALIDLDKASLDSAIQNFGNQLTAADVALLLRRSRRPGARLKLYGSCRG
jgi:hypothetical protein